MGGSNAAGAWAQTEPFLYCQATQKFLSGKKNLHMETYPPVGNFLIRPQTPKETPMPFYLQKGPTDPHLGWKRELAGDS